MRRRPDGLAGDWRLVVVLAALAIVTELTWLWIRVGSWYPGSSQAVATTRAGILTLGAASVAALVACGGIFVPAQTIQVNRAALIETEKAGEDHPRLRRQAPTGRAEPMGAGVETSRAVEVLHDRGAGRSPRWTVASLSRWAGRMC